MGDVPSFIPGTFIATVIALLLFVGYALDQSTSEKKVLTTSITITMLVAWIFFVSVLTFNGFFEDYSSPPRLAGFVLGPLVFTVLLFMYSKSRKVLMDMPIATLHYLHIVRVPVEMVLWWLAAWMLLPKELTFEGDNMDILSGISAPFAAVFMLGGRSKSKLGGIMWNVICLGMLINIVAMAVSYSPYFYDPQNGAIANTAIFVFPYVLLPTFVVPVVLFAHLTSLYQLIFKKDQSQY